MVDGPGTAGAGLRIARQARGFSQQQLAGMAGVSRQAVSAVESGHSDPSLRVALALAQALGMSVEQLFGPGEPTAPVTAVSVAPLAARGAGAGPGRRERAGGVRVMLAPVGDRFVALPLRGDTGVGLGFLPAGGLAARGGPPPAARPARRRARRAAGRRVRGDRRPPDRPAPPHGRRGRLRPGPPAARHPAVAARPAGRLRLVAVRLGRGAPAGPGRPGARGRRAHPDRQRRRRHGLPDGAEVVGFTAWREGLAVRPDLRAAVTGLDAIAQRRLRLVNREPGAEARRLLDRERARLNLDPADLIGYDTEAAGHLQVASAVAAGLADAGVASEPAARAYGLAFVPLARERFNLVIPAEHAASREAQALLQGAHLALAAGPARQHPRL